MLRMRLKATVQRVRVWVLVSLVTAAVFGFLAVAATGVKYEDGRAEFVKEQLDEAVKQGKVLNQRDIQRIADSYPDRTDPYDVASWRYFSTAFRQASFLMAGLVFLIGVIARVKGAESVWFTLVFLILGFCFAAPLATYAAVVAAVTVAWFIVKSAPRKQGGRG
jgi:cobalamin synthase